MNKIEKLFRKISKKEGLLLKEVIESIECRDKNLTIKKLSGNDFYRVRKRMFRIIFHHSPSEEVVIDSVRIKEENTYKNL